MMIAVATRARIIDGQSSRCQRDDITKPTKQVPISIAIAGGNSENATDSPTNVISGTAATIGIEPVVSKVDTIAIAIVPTAAPYVKLPVIAIAIAVQPTETAHAITFAQNTLARNGFVGDSADAAITAPSMTIQVAMQTIVMTWSPIGPLVRSRA